MFIGHYAVGFAGKKLAPKTSLGTLFLAAGLMDFLFTFLLLCGVEHLRIDPGNTAVVPLDLYDFPFSHSLMFALFWSVLFSLLYCQIRKYPRGSLVLGGLVFSHWLLDLVSHRPDLPLFPGSETMLVLGLWNSLAGTAAVELGLFAVGVWLYASSTKAVDRRGKYALWALVVFLLVVQIINYQGDPPPSVGVFAWVGLSAWLIILWAWWIDRHRRVRGGRGYY
ncbi:MAG TPA: metal-dependent hydrolase [archaeon]|nr:metal-dependent hydrolase [archaeon]